MTETKKYVLNQADIFDCYKVDQIALTTGLAVIKKCRSRGIATRILKARASVLRRIGLKVTTSVFSTIGGQKAARAAGYLENYAIPFDDLNTLFPEMDFGFVSGNSCRVMSFHIDHPTE